MLARNLFLCNVEFALSRRLELHMSSDTASNSMPQHAPGQTGSTHSSEPTPNWEPLPALERRILGVLVEKQKTSKTADAYPLTLNALLTGCNQKSNRDPVLDLDEDVVEQGLATLQKKGLVVRITGGRAERFKHTLYENWTKAGPELAVLAELLLRGPQTKGDLRVRASRMAPIETQESLEEVLQPLVARKLVIFLTDPDRRGAVLTHGFHLPEELGRLRAAAANAPTSVLDIEVSTSRAAMPSPQPAASASLEARIAAAIAEIEELKSRVAGLENGMSELRKQFGISE
jgi:uncharacterized protein YceH (UPF0502 family)